jgi:formylglycine-generating enzyme required for sulfatase activity
LGKFTAISLRWPLLLLDLENDGQLLQKLQDFALRDYFPLPETEGVKPDDAVRYWGSHPKLKELIAKGCLEKPEGAATLQINPKFSLAALKVERLLQVSPKVVRSTLNQDQKTQTAPVRITSLPGDFNLEMVDIPAGKFLMGSDSEKPIHQVTVKAFRMGKYPVTQAQYEAVMGTNPSKFGSNPNHPVEQVSWFDAQAFCEKLSQLTGQSYRLPTEAEWEYACRAGTQTRFSFGDDQSQLGDYAWFDGNSDSKTHPVGEKRANPWGLYDVHGNVWEWCADQWHERYADKPDNLKQNGNIAWVDGNITNQSLMLLRGGSWSSLPGNCRSAYRKGNFPDGRSSIIGLRVVASSRT